MELGVLHVAVKTQGALQVLDPPSSMPVTCDDGGQRSIAVALGGVFSGKDIVTERDHFEAASRGARHGDAPVPAAVLMEYVEGTGRLAQR